MRIAIIGAGAAGCFCAAQLRRWLPELAITIFEAGARPMAKLAITGGGRCNLTNDFQDIRSLAEAYPRGERVMKRALKAFSQEDTIAWFQDRGVPCVLQEDHCWFPQSQDAMDIVHALMHAMKGVDLRLKTPVVSVGAELCSASAKNQADATAWKKMELCSAFANNKVDATAEHSSASYAGAAAGKAPEVCSAFADNKVDAAAEHTSSARCEALFVNGEPFDAVVISTGGAPKGLPFLEALELNLVPPVPSLFTFTVKDPALNTLTGLVVEAQIGLQGTSFKAEGPLLITDWGFSGPATLKLSSYAARHLAENSYRGILNVNWLNANENEVRALLQKTAAENPQKQVSSTHLLQARLWNHLLERAGLRKDIRWAELGSKGLNRLTATLTGDSYPLSGKSKFREEFVTAGGVALSNVDLNTLECKRHPGLFFAGEVLDIDAITGGFNLQAAWSTAYVCAQAIRMREIGKN